MVKPRGTNWTRKWKFCAASVIRVSDMIRPAVGVPFHLGGLGVPFGWRGFSVWAVPSAAKIDFTQEESPEPRHNQAGQDEKKFAHEGRL
jgi:hypothetical protein